MVDFCLFSALYDSDFRDNGHVATVRKAFPTAEDATGFEELCLFFGWSCDQSPSLWCQCGTARSISGCFDGGTLIKRAKMSPLWLGWNRLIWWECHVMELWWWLQRLADRMNLWCRHLQPHSARRWQGLLSDRASEEIWTVGDVLGWATTIVGWW